MDALISVIVPIYNVAPYLDKCISSIRNQTYHNIEIILVDDGSTDESGDICDKHAEEDGRIHVIHQENGHIMRARKAGVRASHGDYIGFVDGDDWIELDMYEDLLWASLSNSADIVLSGMFRDNNEGTYAVWPASKDGAGLYEGEKLNIFKRYTLSNNNGSICNKLFKRDNIISELNRVDDDLYGIEDDLFSHMCIIKADRIIVMKKIYYHGYERMDSATHTRHMDYYLMMHRALPLYTYMMEIFPDPVFAKECQACFAKKVLSGLNHVFNHYSVVKYILPPDTLRPRPQSIVLYGGVA